MNRLSRFWSWLGTHALAVKVGSVVAAVAFLAAGLVLGVHQASHAAAPAATSPSGVVEHVSSSRHVVVGVVRSVGLNEIEVRNARGIRFVVHWGARSSFREKGRDIAPSSIRSGDRVLVLGAPAADGSLTATVVSVTARAPLPKTVKPAGTASTAGTAVVRRTPAAASTSRATATATGTATVPVP